MNASSTAGFSFIELLVVVAVIGVLFSIAAIQANPAAVATSQAAQAVSAAASQARFEAVRTNNTAGLVVSQGDGRSSGTVAMCSNVDESSFPLACDAGSTTTIVDLSVGDLRRAVIASPEEVTVFFDRRGIVRNPASDDHVITITDRSGGNSRTVTINPTGRTEVQ